MLRSGCPGLGFLAAGDLLAGGVDQAVRVRRGRVQRGQLVAGRHDGKTLRGSGRSGQEAPSRDEVVRQPGRPLQMIMKC